MARGTQGQRAAPSRWAWLMAAVLAVLMVRGLAQVAQWPWLYALLVLPGTVMHEASHALVAWALGARPQGFDVWPERLPNGTGWLLGSVAFVPNHWNVAAIALAPLGLFGWGVSCLRWAVHAKRWPWRLLWVYGAACAFASSWPSPIDWQLAWGAPLSWPLALGAGVVWHAVLFRGWRRRVLGQPR